MNNKEIKKIGPSREIEIEQNGWIASIVGVAWYATRS
jgi:hypothetical protein